MTRAGKEREPTHDPSGSDILWPAGFAPADCPVRVRNEIEIAAPPDMVWAWLVRPLRWPSYYPNSRRVRILEGGPEDLSLGTRFHWWTFDVPITSQVQEFVPYERLAWDAKGLGVSAYHAWLITPTQTGCRVLTEETQHGWGARLQGLLMPNRMHRQHQVWLEALKTKAEGGRLR